MGRTYKINGILRRRRHKNRAAIFGVEDANSNYAGLRRASVNFVVMQVRLV
jgi:hypothetical protein